MKVPILHLLHLLPIILGQPPDENCTRIELGKTPVPRIGCAAESCLRCNGVDAKCVHNGTSNTFTCTANTTTCSVELCPLCSYCVGAYIQPLGNSGFRHHSLCAFMSSVETCEDAGANEQCVVNRNVSSESVPNSDGALSYLCRCYGENCTEQLLYSYSILPQPSSIVLQSVAMRTSSSLSATPTPGIISQSVAMRATSVTPSPEIGNGDGTHPTGLPLRYIITIVVLFAAILVTLLILFITLCIIRVKKGLIQSQHCQVGECVEMQEDYDKIIE